MPLISDVQVSETSVWDQCWDAKGSIRPVLEKAQKDLSLDLSPLISREKTQTVKFRLSKAGSYVASALRSALLCEVEGWSLKILELKTNDKSIVHQWISLQTSLLRLRPEAARATSGSVRFSMQNPSADPREVFLDDNPVLRKLIVGRVPMGILQGGCSLQITFQVVSGKARDMPGQFPAVHTVINVPQISPHKTFQQDATEFLMGYSTYSDEGKHPLRLLKEAVSVVAEYCENATKDPWLDAAGPVFKTPYTNDIATKLAVHYILQDVPDVHCASQHIDEEEAVLRVDHPEAKKIIVRALLKAAGEMRKMLADLEKQKK